MPTKMDTTARLARAFLRLDSNPFPSSVPPPTIEMFRRIADHLPGPLRPILGPVLKNTDKLKPLLARALVAAGNESAAMTRTTTVVTHRSGTPPNNLIDPRATAGANLRNPTGDTNPRA